MPTANAEGWVPIPSLPKDASSSRILSDGYPLGDAAVAPRRSPSACSEKIPKPHAPLRCRASAIVDGMSSDTRRHRRRRVLLCDPASTLRAFQSNVAPAHRIEKKNEGSVKPVSPGPSQVRQAAPPCPAHSRTRTNARTCACVRHAHRECVRACRWWCERRSWKMRRSGWKRSWPSGTS